MQQSGSAQSLMLAMQQDIESLQVKVAYQEDTIEQLNQIVTQQQEQLQRISKLCERMVEKLKAMPSDDNAINEGTELPPHY